LLLIFQKRYAFEDQQTLTKFLNVKLSITKKRKYFSITFYSSHGQCLA
jgi:hypothetical protein